jgi:hypothetical protein
MSATDGTISTARSPFALLRDADEAEEVLLLTYTASLEFFERFALGEARGLQAATTVISDAAMVTVDPLTVRGAGVRYIEARAVCPGHAAFHPKLLVIASRSACTVAVGSGNVTLAGWHGNDELWTVVRADVDRGPRTVGEVSAFLRALASGPIQLSAEAPDVLTRVAKLLDGMAADDPGPALVSTLDGPIIEQLPRGPVDELVVYAPFFDPRLAALDALQERLDPSRTTVFVQPQTSVDGNALAAWLARREAELKWCSDERYRHGKVIEWSREGVREALTGSPNLSGAALLHRLEADSSRRVNCELATITRVPESLAPPEAAPPADGLTGLVLSADPAEAPRPGTILLGATLVDGIEVHVRLASDLAGAARVQTYDADRDWATVPGLTELTPGRRDYRFPAIGLPPGRPLRLLGSSGASNEVFVSDPVRARRRPVRRVGLDAGSPTELLLDGRFAVLFEIADLMRPTLLQLGAMVPKTAPRPSGGDESGAGSAAGDGRVAPAKGQTLADYLAACAAVVDDATVEWALALPSLPGLGGDGGFDRKVGLLTSETDDEAADAGETEKQAPPPDFADALRRASELRRRQFRRFCEGVLERATAWPNLMRAYGARLILNAIAADVWRDDDVRGHMLGRLVDILVAAGDDPTDEEREALASYLAVTLALLRHEVRRLSVNDEPTMRFKAAAAKGRAALDDLDPARLDTLAAELEEAFGDTVTGERIFDLAAEIQSPPSGLSSAIELLREEDGVTASDDDGVLLIHDPLPRVPERELLRIAGLVDAQLVAVRGRTNAGVEVACVWHSPRLLIARRTQSGLGGRLYYCPDSPPNVIAAGWMLGRDVRDNLPRVGAEWFPGRPAPADALELLRATRMID